MIDLLTEEEPSLSQVRTLVMVAAGAALAFGVLVWYFAFDEWRTMTGDLFVQAVGGDAV